MPLTIWGEFIKQELVSGSLRRREILSLLLAWIVLDSALLAPSALDAVQASQDAGNAQCWEIRGIDCTTLAVFMRLAAVALVLGTFVFPKLSCCCLEKRQSSRNARLKNAHNTDTADPEGGSACIPAQWSPCFVVFLLLVAALAVVAPVIIVSVARDSLSQPNHADALLMSAWGSPVNGHATLSSMFLLFLVATAVPWKAAVLWFMFVLSLVIASSMIALRATGLLQSQLVQSEAAAWRPVLAFAALTGFCALTASESERSAWGNFVQRKRLQLQAVRSEELLALAMPRRVAHNLMRGESLISTHSHVSVAFLYITGFNEMVEAAQGEALLGLLEDLHQLWCRLDALVLAHPHIHKIESVANVYLVASGVPNAHSEHAASLIEFSLQALELCRDMQLERELRTAEEESCRAELQGHWQDGLGPSAFEDTDNLPFVPAAPAADEASASVRAAVGEQWWAEERGRLLASMAADGDMVWLGELEEAVTADAESSAAQWRFKVGVTSGAVTGGVIGLSRTYYRLFGDVVNTSSRLGVTGTVGRVHISQATYGSLGMPPCVNDTVPPEVLAELQSRQAQGEALPGKGGKGGMVLPLSEPADMDTETVANKRNQSVPWYFRAGFNFRITCRGVVRAKGKGLMVTYLADRPTSDYLLSNSELLARAARRGRARHAQAWRHRARLLIMREVLGDELASTLIASVQAEERLQGGGESASQGGGAAPLARRRLRHVPSASSIVSVGSTMSTNPVGGGIAMSTQGRGGSNGTTGGRRFRGSSMQSMHGEANGEDAPAGDGGALGMLRAFNSELLDAAAATGSGGVLSPRRTPVDGSGRTSNRRASAPDGIHAGGSGAPVEDGSVSPSRSARRSSESTGGGGHTEAEGGGHRRTSSKRGYQGLRLDNLGSQATVTGGPTTPNGSAVSQALQDQAARAARRVHAASSGNSSADEAPTAPIAAPVASKKPQKAPARPRRPSLALRSRFSVADIDRLDSAIPEHEHEENDSMRGMTDGVEEARSEGGAGPPFSPPDMGLISPLSRSGTREDSGSGTNSSAGQSRAHTTRPRQTSTARRSLFSFDSGELEGSASQAEQDASKAATSGQLFGAFHEQVQGVPGDVEDNARDVDGGDSDDDFNAEHETLQNVSANRFLGAEQGGGGTAPQRKPPPSTSSTILQTGSVARSRWGLAVSRTQLQNAVGGPVPSGRPPAINTAEFRSSSKRNASNGSQGTIAEPSYHTTFRTTARNKASPMAGGGGGVTPVRGGAGKTLALLTAAAAADARAKAAMKAAVQAAARRAEETDSDSSPRAGAGGGGGSKTQHVFSGGIYTRRVPKGSLRLQARSSRVLPSRALGGTRQDIQVQGGSVSEHGFMYAGATPASFLAAKQVQGGVKCPVPAFGRDVSTVMESPTERGGGISSGRTDSMAPAAVVVLMDEPQQGGDGGVNPMTTRGLRDADRLNDAPTGSFDPLALDVAAEDAETTECFLFAQVLSSIANALLQVPAQDALLVYRYLSDPITARCKVHFIRQMEALYLQRFLLSATKNTASMRISSDHALGQPGVGIPRHAVLPKPQHDSDDDIDEEDAHVVQVVAGDMLSRGGTSGATQLRGVALPSAPLDSDEGGDTDSLGIRSDSGDSDFNADAHSGSESGSETETDSDSSSDSSLSMGDTVGGGATAVGAGAGASDLGVESLVDHVLMGRARHKPGAGGSPGRRSMHASMRVGGLVAVASAGSGLKNRRASATARRKSRLSLLAFMGARPTSAKTPSQPGSAASTGSARHTHRRSRAGEGHSSSFASPPSSSAGGGGRTRSDVERQLQAAFEKQRAAAIEAEQKQAQPAPEHSALLPVASGKWRVKGGSSEEEAGAAPHDEILGGSPGRRNTARNPDLQEQGSMGDSKQSATKPAAPPRLEPAPAPPPKALEGGVSSQDDDELDAMLQVTPRRQSALGTLSSPPPNASGSIAAAARRSSLLRGASHHSMRSTRSGRSRGGRRRRRKGCCYATRKYTRRCCRTAAYSWCGTGYDFKWGVCYVCGLDRWSVARVVDMSFDSPIMEAELRMQEHTHRVRSWSTVIGWLVLGMLTALLLTVPAVATLVPKNGRTLEGGLFSPAGLALIVVLVLLSTIVFSFVFDTISAFRILERAAEFEPGEYEAVPNTDDGDIPGGNSTGGMPPPLGSNLHNMVAGARLPVASSAGSAGVARPGQRAGLMRRGSSALFNLPADHAQHTKSFSMRNGPVCTGSFLEHTVTPGMVGPPSPITAQREASNASSGGRSASPRRRLRTHSSIGSIATDEAQEGAPPPLLSPHQLREHGPPGGVMASPSVNLPNQVHTAPMVQVDDGSMSPRPLATVSEAGGDGAYGTAAPHGRVITVMDTQITVPYPPSERCRMACVACCATRCPTVLRGGQWLHASLSARSAVLVLASLLLLLLGDTAALNTHYPDGTPEDVLFHSALLPALWLAVSHVFRLRTGMQAATCLCIIVLHWVMAASWGLLRRVQPLAALQVAVLLFSIAALTVYNTYRVELNARRVLLLVMASRRAKRQADNVMGQLLPVSVNSALSRNESIPFQILPHSVVILWADLVGFTALSSKLDSLGVLRMLHNIFVQFDALVESANLWKLDTIGDAYVVIGGLQEDIDGPSLVERQFALALSMQRIVADIAAQTGGEIGIRVGIHAGPVATGIIGTLRPRFYVFGRTVLEAEHMEATGEPGRVQVSPEAAQLYSQRTYGLRSRSQPPLPMFNKKAEHNDGTPSPVQSVWLHPLGSQAVMQAAGGK